MHIPIANSMTYFSFSFFPDLVKNVICYLDTPLFRVRNKKENHLFAIRWGADNVANSLKLGNSLKSLDLFKGTRRDSLLRSLWNLHWWRHSIGANHSKQGNKIPDLAVLLYGKKTPLIVQNFYHKNWGGEKDLALEESHRSRNGEDEAALIKKSIN